MECASNDNTTFDFIKSTTTTPIKDITIVEFNDVEMKFILENATNELAALFRKIIMTEVPTMAIYNVNIYKNTTVYETFNIIRKLGFIPLKINPNRYVFPEKCECTFMLRQELGNDKEIYGGCKKCSCFFSLMVYGENSNSKNTIRRVTSKEIWCNDYENLFENIPEIDIVNIKNKEELMVTCKAFKGCGKTHARWSPVTVVTFSKIDNSSKEEEEDIPKYKEDQKYIFYFEAVGSLLPIDILKKANEIYQNEKFRLSREKYDIRHRYLPDEH